MGLNITDYNELISSVNIIVNTICKQGHSTLQNTLKINTAGTIELLNLAKQANKLKLFMHISTVYAASYIKDSVIKEKVYSQGDDPEDLLNLILKLSNAAAEQTKSNLLNKYQLPDSYALSQ